jgi:hypothetical protein
MAIIIPFGDPNAHGSLADSVTFRRVRGGVCFQKKPNPVIRNTLAQQAQRTAFTTAQSLWFGYDVLSKPYIETRASQLGLTARQLFSRAYLLDQLPDPAPLPFRALTAVQMIDPDGATGADTQFGFEGWDTVGNIWTSLGTFDVDSNTWSSWSEFPNDFFPIRIQLFATKALAFRFGFAVTIKKPDTTEISQIWRMPPGLYDWQTGVYLYISGDGSTWTDDTFTQWLATNNF